MATNKNQHFVPRCYLRPFTLKAANQSINLFNIDKKLFVCNAAVKHQCTKDYFYGENLHLEKALQLTESTYASTLREILSPGYELTVSHKSILRRFWLLQHLRTEAASRRAVESYIGMGKAIIGEEAEEVKVGEQVISFKLTIKEAVIDAMKTYVNQMHIMDDMKVCLLKNKTNVPLITSDDPAILTNRWHFQDRRRMGLSFGLGTSGDLMFLPLSPKVLCIGYDGDVYSIPHKYGWSEIKSIADVSAINQHQILNCRANVFTDNPNIEAYLFQILEEAQELRPKSRYQVNYAILDGENEEGKQFRVVENKQAEPHQEAMVHIQQIYPKPNLWPKQLKWRQNGSVYSDGSATGFVRKARADADNIRRFRKLSIKSSYFK